MKRSMSRAIDAKIVTSHTPTLTSVCQRCACITLEKGREVYSTKKWGDRHSARVLKKEQTPVRNIRPHVHACYPTCSTPLEPSHANFMRCRSAKAG
jgi:hypothetical protein